MIFSLVKMIYTGVVRASCLSDCSEVDISQSLLKWEADKIQSPMAMCKPSHRRAMLTVRSSLTLPPPALTACPNGVWFFHYSSVYFCPYHTLFQVEDRVPFVHCPKSDV